MLKILFFLQLKNYSQTYPTAIISNLSPTWLLALKLAPRNTYRKQKNSNEIINKRESLDICLHQSDLNLGKVSLPIEQIASTVTGNNRANPSNYPLWNPKAELTHLSLGADSSEEPFVSIYFR